jgi:HlyD family secretion protein
MVIRLIVIIIGCVWVLGCSKQPTLEAQGYIEGRYTYMATSVSGVLKQLLVNRGTWVKQGQALFVLEEQPESDIYKAAIEKLKQSVAARDAILANLNYAKITFDRYKILLPSHAIDRGRLDNARSVYEALVAELSHANANIAESKETLAQSKWTKEQKRIAAPVDAIVFDTFYREGEYTEAGSPILSLLAPGDIKAVFYVRESALGNLKLREKVKIQCDHCNKIYTGIISYISPSAEYTPPVIFSRETSYKLVYRIEAQIVSRDVDALHPGQPIRVSL